MESSEIKQNPVRQMLEHFNLMQWSVILLSVFIIGAVFCYQVYQQKMRYQDRLESYVLERAGDLDTALESTGSQILMMKLWAEDKMQHDSTDASQPLFEMVHSHDNYFYLEPLPHPFTSLKGGNFSGSSVLNTRDDAFLREAIMALDLFDLQRSSLSSNPYFVWSQYLSKRQFYTVYLKMPGEDMLQASPDGQTGAFFSQQSHLISEYFSPENETDGVQRWHNAEIDAYGAGTLMRYSVAVSQGDEVLGLLITGIDTGFLQDAIKDCPLPESNMLLVDVSGQVLAQCAETVQSAGSIPLLNQILPDNVNNDSFDSLAQRDGFHASGGYQVYIKTLDQAPWKLILYYPNTRLLWLLLPAILTGLVLAALITVFVYMQSRQLRRNFITPSIALVDYIQTELQDETATVAGSKSPAWDQLFKKINDTFALKSATGNIPGAVYRLARNRQGLYNLHFLSSGIYEFLGYQPSEITFSPSGLKQFIPKAGRDLLFKVIEESASSKQPFHYECRVLTKSGEYKWARFISRPRDAGNGETVWDGLILDITDRKELENDLFHLAATDVLTGINNRRQYMTLSEKEFSRFIRNRFVFSVILFDIDRFKKVNDTYGHPAGDQVLVDVAEILSASVREEDITGRVGGEEFAITLVNSDLEHAMRVAERIRHSVEQHVTQTSAGEMRVTISAGVTQVNIHDRDLSALLNRADKGLYDAKNTGRNRVIGV